MADKKSNATSVQETENTQQQESSKEPIPPPQIKVHVTPITPVGNLIGYASVNFNNSFVVEGFKILQGEKDLFIGMPSRADSKSSTGYRDTAKPITAEFRTQLTEAITKAYYVAVEKLQARAESFVVPDKQSVKKQLADGAKQATKDNATQSAQGKNNKTRDTGR